MLLNNSWYLDDGILAGTEAELLHSLDILESEGKGLGFNVRKMGLSTQATTSAS